MRLSVVIPIYNVETTLERCLNSVIVQGVEGMEVIMVDDGSKDGSAEIARRIGDAHPCCIYIRQENRGLSAARNTGIRVSHGEYITFVDSDDWLLDNTLAPLLQILNDRPDCDILEYSVIKLKDNKEERITLPDATYIDARTYWLQGKAYSHTYACNKLFRRTLFQPENAEPILFREGYFFEDAEFLGRLLPMNPTVITTSCLGYVYQQNPNGITATADGRKLAMLLKAHLNAASNLNMTFMHPNAVRPIVVNEESALYLSLLNIQISVCQQTHCEPILPDCRVRLCHAHSLPMLLKILLQNTAGIRRICLLWK